MEFWTRLKAALDLLRPSTWGTLPLDDWIQTLMRQTVIPALRPTFRTMHWPIAW